MQTEKPNSKTRFWAGTVSTSLFLACIVGALTTFESPGSRPFSWSNPFAWDAPTQTVTQYQVLEKEAGKSASIQMVNSAGDTVILDDWNYTAITRGKPQPPSKHK
jgi:hypothetical protein